jgi:hypothetical protein
VVLGYKIRTIAPKPSVERVAGVVHSTGGIIGTHMLLRVLLGDDARSPCCDLVVRGVDSVTPGKTTLGDTVPSPEYSGAIGPRVARLLLPGVPIPACQLGVGGE